MTAISNAVLAKRYDFSESDIQLIRENIAHVQDYKTKQWYDWPDEALALLLRQAKAFNLDPLSGQICCVKKGGRWLPYTQIHGLRLMAARTECYAPGSPTVFETKDDGEQTATVFVKLLTADNTWHEVAETAYLSEYVGGSPIWKDKPHVMLAKCAEAQALRRAFPAELGDLYTIEELDKDDPPPTPAADDAPEPASQAWQGAVHQGTIKSVSPRSVGKNRMIYRVICDDGEAFETFQKKMTDGLQPLVGTGQVVGLQYSTSQQYGNRLEGVESVAAPAVRPQAEPPAGDEPPPPGDADAPDSEPADAAPAITRADLNTARKEAKLSVENMQALATALGFKSLQSKNWTQAECKTMLGTMASADVLTELLGPPD